MGKCLCTCARYCSKKRQTEDWQRHKWECEAWLEKQKPEKRKKAGESGRGGGGGEGGGGGGVRGGG